MARTKDFSEALTLAKAADIFTRLGFGTTSFSTLTAELGVAKQSLYHAFGDKESLYLQALDKAASTSSVGRALMQREKTGLARVNDFLQTLVDECIDPDHPGCMVSSGLLEQSVDSRLGLQLQQKWLGTQELLRATIEDGQRDGSIKSQRRSAALAQVLMNTMAGMRVLRKAVTDTVAQREALINIMTINLELLQR